MTTVLNLNPITKLTREQFVQLCQVNPELQLERNAQGELIIMSPLGGESGKKEANLIFDISLWNRQTQLGFVFSSSTIFHLPGGSVRVALLCKSLSRCCLGIFRKMAKSYSKRKRWFSAYLS